MRKQILFFVGLFFSMHLFAQTGIGTPTPDASAKLDVYSTNKGFLPPRITLTGISDNSTIASPATGLLVYNTGANVGLAAGYYFWNGNAWATIATAGGSGSFAASFLRGSRTAAQSSIAVGGIVSFSAVDNTSGQDISLNTTNGKITLAPGNTYRLIAAVPNFTGNRPAFMWYNETSSSYIGSATNGYSPTDGASGAGAFGGIAEVITTPSVSTVLSFRLLSSLSSGAITVGGLVDFSTTGSYPWFEAQLISGNAPVTGQSVDYIQASLSTNQALSAAGNIIFNTSSGTGISITSGGFNLIANKTYKLEAAIGGTSGGYAYYAWVDNSNNLLPGGSIGAVMKAGTAYTDAPQDKAVVYFTPIVDTRVFLRVYSLSGTLTAYAPSTSSNYSSSWASIEQIGSSAFVNPWTLSGTNTFNTTGNVGIGTNTPTAKLNIAGGGIKIFNGFANNSTLRPGINKTIIGNYEIRGVGGAGSATQADGGDDGFLRLSAGGGTASDAQSFIDISGYSSQSDMNKNIVFGTSGLERMRIDPSGNVNITGKLNIGDPTGNVAIKTAGFVNAGTFVTLDNIKCTIPTSGNRSLVVTAVSTTFTANVSATFGYYAGNGGLSYYNQSITTSTSLPIISWNFPIEGDGATYILNDKTNSRVYRIIMMIGASFNNNFISIERLY
jgi:hypothetical protein